MKIAVRISNKLLVVVNKLNTKFTHINSGLYLCMSEQRAKPDRQLVVKSTICAVCLYASSWRWNQRRRW